MTATVAAVTFDDAVVAHGVGPWEGPRPTGEAAARLDPALLDEGDARNVADHYRYWSVDAIVADLDSRRSGLQIAMENTGHDFNIGSVVRTANAFNVSRVHIVGRRRWNRRGAMVTDRYMHITHHESSKSFVHWAGENEVPLIAIDNLPGATPVTDVAFPNPACLVFGEEGPGLSDAVWNAATARVEIAQYGSTRSINLGAAAAICMYAWTAQHPPQPFVGPRRGRS